VDGDEVALRQQLVQADQPDADLRGPGRLHVRVVGEQPDAERGQPLGDQYADPAEADHADGLVGQLDAGEPGPLPLPRLQRRVRGRDVAGDREQQRDRVLGGADDVGGRRVDDHDAAGGGRGHVDVVQPDAGPGDDLEPVGRGQRLGVDPGGAADQHRVHAGQRRQQRGSVGPVDVVQLELGGQHLQRGRRELLGDEDDRTALGLDHS
jgi:hypothetical protein